MSYKSALNELYLEKIASEVFGKEAALGSAVLSVGKKVMSSRLGRNMVGSAVAGGATGAISESMKPSDSRGSILKATSTGALTGAATGGAISLMTGNKLNVPLRKSKLTGNKMNTISSLPQVSIDRTSRGFNQRINSVLGKTSVTEVKAPKPISSPQQGPIDRTPKVLNQRVGRVSGKTM